jgi:hypothetical protein
MTKTMNHRFTAPINMVTIIKKENPKSSKILFVILRAAIHVFEIANTVQALIAKLTIFHPIARSNTLDGKRFNGDTTKNKTYKVRLSALAARAADKNVPCERTSQAEDMSIILAGALGFFKSPRSELDNDDIGRRFRYRMEKQKQEEEPIVLSAICFFFSVVFFDFF